jgi:hypothetical protein
MPNLIKTAAPSAVMTDHQSTESFLDSIGVVSCSGFCVRFLRLVVMPACVGTRSLLRNQCARERTAKTSYLGSKRPDIRSIHAHGYGTEAKQAQTGDFVDFRIPGCHYSDCKRANSNAIR